MATAIATKPAPPPSTHKIRRPPPPVQTPLNGARSSQSSPSPSLSSKRPVAGFKQPPPAIPTSGPSTNVNGTGPRTSNRRRDSQRPGDISARQNRNGKTGPQEALDRRLQKRKPEPYVKSPYYILKKFRNSPPSLIIHLHPTHFRFHQQDGSFPYNSPMNIILEHIKASTVPHDLIEELTAAGVKFYDGCLIVQVHDHKSVSQASSSSTTHAVHEKYKPFSIHNYNEHLTPSPYVPYPRLSSQENKSKPTKNGQGVGIVQGGGNVKGSTASKAPKIYTTVLMSTPLSLQEEVFLYANRPDPRSNNRKQSQSSLSRTPASATIPHPPTPLSAVPLTPSGVGPPAKKQKMLIGESDTCNFEASATTATAPPLFLDPVDTFQDSQKLLEKLSDPPHAKGYPASKTRKRTSAELAADEAQAAQEERFMLIMDERLAPSGSGGAGAKTADGETRTAAFEPSFDKFKALEAIKAAQHEKAQRQREAQSEQAAAKSKQERLEQETARQAQEQKLVEARREQEMRRMQGVPQQVPHQSAALQPAAQHQSVQQQGAQQQAAQQQAAQQQAAQQQAAQQQAAQQQAAQQQAAQQQAAQQQAAQQQAAQQQPTQQQVAQQQAAQQQVAQQQAAQQQAAQQQAAQQQAAQNQAVQNQAIPNQGIQNQVAQNHVAQNHVAQNHVAQSHVAQNHVAQNHVTQNHVTQNHVTQSHIAANQAALAALQQQQTHQHNINTGQNQLSYIPTPNGLVANISQNPPPTSQPHHASPVIRNMSSQNHSSPSAGNIHSSQSVVMKPTTSSQGNTSSPARPSSALQHGHPVGGVTMVPNRSQQPPSRRGTPQVGHGTPSIQNMTPPMHNLTPTPRMNHASPPNSLMQTPVMNQTPTAQQHLVGQQLTQQQQQQILERQAQQRAYIHQQQQQQQQQAQAVQAAVAMGNPQMVTPTGLQVDAHTQRHHQELYQQQLRNHHQQMSPHMAPTAASPAVSQGQPGHQALVPAQAAYQVPQPGQNPQQRSGPNMVMLQQLFQRTYSQILQRMTFQQGLQAPTNEIVQQAKTQANLVTQNWLQSQRGQAATAAQLQYYANQQRALAQAQTHSQAQVHPQLVGHPHIQAQAGQTQVQAHQAQAHQVQAHQVQAHQVQAHQVQAHTAHAHAQAQAQAQAHAQAHAQAQAHAIMTARLQQTNGSLAGGM